MKCPLYMVYVFIELWVPEVLDTNYRLNVTACWPPYYYRELLKYHPQSTRFGYWPHLSHQLNYKVYLTSVALTLAFMENGQSVPYNRIYRNLSVTWTNILALFWALNEYTWFNIYIFYNFKHTWITNFKCVWNIT